MKAHYGKVYASICTLTAELRKGEEIKAMLEVHAVVTYVLTSDKSALVIKLEYSK